jgi:hypothetical protein
MGVVFLLAVFTLVLVLGVVVLVILVGRLG